MRTPRMTFAECMKEANRLGIPVRQSRGSHILLCPPGQPSVTVSKGRMNDIVCPKAMKLIRHFQEMEEQKNMPSNAPADLRVRAMPLMPTTVAVAAADPDADKLPPAQIHDAEPGQPATLQQLQAEIKAAVSDAQAAKAMHVEAVLRIKQLKVLAMQLVDACNEGISTAGELGGG